MTTKTEQYSEATAALDSAQSILVVTHINPDGDAIGSLLGLTHALRERYPNKPVTAAVDEGVPDFLMFLPGVDRVFPSLTEGTWDLMVSVDASDEVRTGECGVYGRAHSQTVINLDHHTTNNFFGQIILVNPTAVSATEVIFDWLNSMNHPLTRNVAVPLLTGLVTDTLGFRTSNVKLRTFEIVQVLINAGASITEITARALDNMSFTTLNLWKQVFGSIQMEDGVIWAVVTQADLAVVGADETTDVGLSSFLNKVSEAMISGVFSETPEGAVELSFRSKTGFDVATVAKSLGGGGHKQASGAIIAGPLEAAIARVLPMLKTAVQTGELAIS